MPHVSPGFRVGPCGFDACIQCRDIVCNSCSMRICHVACANIAATAQFPGRHKSIKKRRRILQASLFIRHQQQQQQLQQRLSIARRVPCFFEASHTVVQVKLECVSRANDWQHDEYKSLAPHTHAPIYTRTHLRLLITILCFILHHVHSTYKPMHRPCCLLTSGVAVTYFSTLVAGQADASNTMYELVSCYDEGR